MGGGAGALIKIDHLVSASVVAGAGAGQLVGGAERDPGYEKQRGCAPAPEGGTTQAAAHTKHVIESCTGSGGGWGRLGAALVAETSICLMRTGS